MNKFVAVAAHAGIAVLSLGAATTTVKVVPKTGAPTALSCDQELKGRDEQIVTLKSRIATLQSALNQKTATVFKCTDTFTSANAAGVTDNCGPYKCNQETGLCRTFARTSDDCDGSQGYNMVNGLCTRG